MNLRPTPMRVSSAQEPALVVVGSINLDLVCSGTRIPAPGETVWGDRFQTFAGGKGANQAVAARRLGVPVRMVGKVGDDTFGAELRARLQHAGVDVQHVGTALDTSSGVALITVDRQGQNSITVIPGANGMLSRADLQACRPQIAEASLVLVQLEIPMATVLCLSEFAEAEGVPLVLDPAPAPKQPLPEALLRRISFLTPNETEICTLCGWPAKTALDPTLAGQAADLLLAKGVSHVLVKLGAQGVLIASQNGTRAFVPAFQVEAVDTTAAGDAFNGGFAVALAKGVPLPQAVEFGSAVAAVAVTRAGAQPAMPTLEEVRHLFASAGRPLPSQLASPERRSGGTGDSL